MDVQSRVEDAYRRLEAQPGFVRRESQVQLSLLLADLMAADGRGLFEAPTGLGKSLAVLIPAFARAAEAGKRTVVATYTNVLAEQYWTKDVPFASSLMQEAGTAALLQGRARYVCLLALDEQAPHLVDLARERLDQGTESEFRRLQPGRAGGELWRKVAVPPVCPARQCPLYSDCYYYRARDEAESAPLVITNHSVVIQDALMRRGESKGLLGDYDFLVLDEAHDFPNAALNGLEQEVSRTKLAVAQNILGRLERTFAPVANALRRAPAWHARCGAARDALLKAEAALEELGRYDDRLGIVGVSPSELADHPGVRQVRPSGGDEGAREVARLVAEALGPFVADAEVAVADARAEAPDAVRRITEILRSYLNYLRELAVGAASLFTTEGAAVSYAARDGQGAYLRQDVLDLRPPLQELLWDRVPYAALSATLALDGTFEHFRNATGADPDYEEVLPSPFDYATQAAVYLPPPGRIPDPSLARREGTEAYYHEQIARELEEIIRACGGRTLALFHSRREMETVYARMSLPPELPVLVQPRTGSAAVGDQFRDDPATSLFALRSFWTGFDAPGETLSCVALVRVPFEVPVEPTAIARVAWMQTQGQDAFRDHALAQAKVLMRQGAGRLVRRAEDRGIIALLDPRLETKRYGPEILENLPPETRRFRDIADAVGWIGLGETAPAR